ncbi:phosphotransferase family protein [Tepidiforma sp.]|uniref:phosphotransferase family protein n=1 Tax=Tepidiforma sp. TaxID=2682230 RepID=UPI002ADE0283|nr:phosphotransferase family protein [Tepidiforma sp.]
MDRAQVAEGLTRFLAARTGGEVRVENLARLSGGASRETWAFDAETPQGRLEGILRADPVPDAPTIPGRELEYHLIRAAWDAGVRVPEPLWDGDDTFPVKFFVMRRVPGETLGARLIRGEQYARAREVVPFQLAQDLARIHAIREAEHPELAALERPPAGKSSAEAQLDYYENNYRTSGLDPHPVFELAIRWLRQHLPQPCEPVLVHGDFRLGNFIFDETGVRAILDWELAHWGDPMEDLGWLAVKSWRFGGKRPIAGVGDREAFIEAYEAAGGKQVNRQHFLWYEMFGNLKWGVITMTQAGTYLSGRNRSVELAAIGRRTAETEIVLLDLLEGRLD